MSQQKLQKNIEKKTMNLKTLKMSMKQSFEKKTARIAVIGMGYVGLPLSVGFAKKGFQCLGFDVDREKVHLLNRGSSYIEDVSSKVLSELVEEQVLKSTYDFRKLEGRDVIFICVPTPFSRTKDPDLSYVETACHEVSQYLRRGQLVVLESTTYPGTTEEIVKPILEKTGLVAGEDFFIAFSPERVDPGNREYSIENTPKVVGGITPHCTEVAQYLYRQLIDKEMVHAVSSAKAAEMTKLLENIFRSVNIALVNELTLLADRMDVNIWEIIEAASTKPFGFMPFYPGPGVGGHCIPVDPYFLSWKAREYDFYTKFIEFAAEVNSNMPSFVMTKLSNILNESCKSIHSSKILLLGLSFKEDISDCRNSASITLLKMLLEKGAHVDYNDPFVPEYVINGRHLYSVDLDLDSLSMYDCVLIATAHSSYDYDEIIRHSTLVFDTKNVTANGTITPVNVRKL